MYEWWNRAIEILRSVWAAVVVLGVMFFLSWVAHVSSPDYFGFGRILTANTVAGGLLYALWRVKRRHNSTTKRR